MAFIFIIFIIILLLKNSKLSRENSLLRIELKRLKDGIIPKEEIESSNVVVEPQKESPPIITEKKEKESVLAATPKHTEKEIKNSTVNRQDDVCKTSAWNPQHSLTVSETHCGNTITSTL